jgi:hypothetical protein
LTPSSYDVLYWVGDDRTSLLSSFGATYLGFRFKEAVVSEAPELVVVSF